MANTYFGNADTSTHLSDASRDRFKIAQEIDRKAFHNIGRVVNVYDTDELAPVGFVDITIMTKLKLGSGEPHDHDIIYEVPYFRLQGGKNAIIINPEVGDIGFIGFCDRDISGIVDTRKDSLPPTNRKNDWADAIYLGGILNGEPEQYVWLKTDGTMVLHSPNSITLSSPTINIDADNFNVKASTKFTGSVQANGHAIDETHTHINSGGTGTGGVVS